MTAITPGKAAVTLGMVAVTPGMVAVTPGMTAITPGMVTVRVGIAAVTLGIGTVSTGMVAATNGTSERPARVFVRLILASASPRRAELLRAEGLEFDVMPADADETVHTGETPDAYVRRVAEAKARAVLPRAQGRPVLAADTVVVVDGAILGKPVDRDDAKRMLRMLSGRAHEVLTGVCLLSRSAELVVEATTVEFAPLSEDDIAWYAATGEPDDKAGAYAIQGLASRFITRISGSYSNVVGLPIERVYSLLKAGDR